MLDGSEHKVCYDEFPPLSANYPWFVAQNLEAGDDKGEQILFTMENGRPRPQHRCRIPQLLGKRIQGCFHGWVILSNHPLNNKWSLWNPVTCKMIHLPPLVLKDEGLIYVMEQCCLSSPPGDPSSILLIITENSSSFIFFRLDRKIKRSKWIKMSYAKQLRNIMGYDGRAVLYSPTCCNGKVYALLVNHSFVLVHIDIAVKDREVVISILRSAGDLPEYSYHPGCFSIPFLKGWGAELFYIITAAEEATKALSAVWLFKLDMTSMEWQEIEDLKEGIFFVDYAHAGFPVYYSNAIASELGGYVHILHMNNRKVIHSYNVKNRTVSLSSLPSPLLPTSLVSLWDSSLQRDHGDIKRRAINPEEEEDKKTEIVARSVSDDKLVSNKSWIEPYNENNESPLLKFPLHVLKMIMEFCVGIEYLKFRATCKHCQLAAPMIRWSKNETALEKLQMYSVASSPWLMVFDKHQGIITFTDPFFGDKYFINTPPDDLIGDMQIHYSSFGWLLIRKYPDGTLMFFNPFTSDIRYLPQVPCLGSYCFSAPPTSPNCMVVGFDNILHRIVYIHFVARDPNWRVIQLNLDAPSFCFPTFYGQGLYALCDDDGGLDSFVDVDNEEDYTWRHLIAESPISNRFGCSKHSFLTKCDKHLLLVVVSELGESIQVFKLNDYNTEWEKIDTLGRYAVYICGATCFCIEAKTPEMENKIYFPRLRNEKLVLYSLETRKYHTIDKNVQEISFRDFLETEHHLNLHAWIEPSWIS